MYRIGRHLSTTYGYAETAKFAHEKRFGVIQIFLTSPRTYGNKRPSNTVLREFGAILRKHNIKLIIHANYMLNFCNPATTSIHMNGVRLLTDDLIQAQIIGEDTVIGVVVHMGKQLDYDYDTAFNTYLTGLRTCLDNARNNVKILLETGAGPGSEICTRMRELGKLRTSIGKRYIKRIGFCIDTCHIYSAGYDIGSKLGVDSFGLEVDTYLGWSNVKCIHLNNSCDRLGSCKDHHAELDRGVIAVSGLRHFVQRCRDIPMVTETPIGAIDEHEMYLVKKWIEII